MPTLAQPAVTSPLMEAAPLAPFLFGDGPSTGGIPEERPRSRQEAAERAVALPTASLGVSWDTHIGSGGILRAGRLRRGFAR